MSREYMLVWVVDEDVIGHIESYHGTHAKVKYVVDDVQYSVLMSSDEYIEMETIEVEMEDAD